MSKEFYIVRGTKTGDPLSAVIFILVIDRVCEPMVAAALVSLNIENERNINPVPLQAFADNIAVVQSKAEVIQKMFDVGESLMNRAGLEVKPSKWAVLYMHARRSGNNWYKGKYDKQPKVTVQNHELSVHGRNTSYKYLGKSLSLSGEDPEQICEIIEEYEDLLSKISKCDLPLALKASAFNNIRLFNIK